MPPVPNVKGFPGVYSDDILSSCEIKDIIHNTQDYDKKARKSVKFTLKKAGKSVNAEAHFPPYNFNFL